MCCEFMKLVLAVWSLSASPVTGRLFVLNTLMSLDTLPRLSKTYGSVNKDFMDVINLKHEKKM